MSNLDEFISRVADFPKAGVTFRDMSPLLRHRFSDAVSAVTSLFSDAEWSKIDAVAGIESRGFIFASALAATRNKGLVLIRKPGKTPNATARATYALEYGSAELEMQAGSGSILLVDDVLATGGTLRAAADLCTTTGYNVFGFAVLVDIKSLNTFKWNKLIARSVLDG
jgi:adenine phosphoribosyltransferase